jgi:hypothetical protein
MKLIKVKGVIYYPVPEIQKYSCEGCELSKFRSKFGICKIKSARCEDGYIYVSQNPNIFSTDIRSEIAADMEDGGMPQGEIESCLNSWQNKYIIKRKEK